MKVIERTVAGAQIVDVCAFGDKFIMEETDQVFKNKKEIKKGECWLGTPRKRICWELVCAKVSF